MKRNKRHEFISCSLQMTPSDHVALYRSHKFNPKPSNFISFCKIFFTLISTNQSVFMFLLISGMIRTGTHTPSQVKHLNRRIFCDIPHRKFFDDPFLNLQLKFRHCVAYMIQKAKGLMRCESIIK